MPELRDWVTEKFGGTGKTLLDESVYSNEDLRKDIHKLEHEQKRLEKKMEDHERKYKALIKEGANAGEMQRKKLAKKAKMQKKKLAIQKKKYKSNNVKLGTMLSVQGMREIMDESHDATDLEFDEVMDDQDAQEIQNKIMERMAAFGVEMEEIQEIGDALDIPIMDDGLEVDTSAEEELMEEVAASEISDGEIAVEADLEEAAEPDIDDIDDVDDFDEFDDDLDEPGLQM